MLQRRKLLKAAAGGIAGAALSSIGVGASAQSDAPIAATPLREGLLRLSGAGGNVVVLDTAMGLVIVDSGAPDRSADLLQAMSAAFGTRPIHTLFNTHWHLAHTGGNAAMVGAAKIVAHENTRLWMSTEFYVRWQDRRYPPRPTEALPNDTFYASDPQPIVLRVGDRSVEYAHLPEAHTDGDIYVRFLEDNVIAAGGAVSVGRYPTLDYSTGGWIGGLVDATQKLLELTDAQTLIVPGHGPAVDRGQLEVQLHMLTTVRERMETRMRQGRSVPEMLAEGITREFDADWGDPALFVSNAYHGLWWVGRTGAAF